MSNTKTNNYKATFIFDTRGYQDSIDTLIQKIKVTIELLHGIIGEVTDLGSKDFVRVTNRKFPSGYYVQFTFTGPTSTPSLLNEKFRLDRTVNRILIQTQAVQI